MSEGGGRGYVFRRRTDFVYVQQEPLGGGGASHAAPVKRRQAVFGHVCQPGNQIRRTRFLAPAPAAGTPTFLAGAPSSRHASSQIPSARATAPRSTQAEAWIAMGVLGSRALPVGPAAARWAAGSEAEV